MKNQKNKTKNQSDQEEAPKPQVPSIARIVHYYDNSAKCHPAVITSLVGVPGQTAVNLKVWFDGGRDAWVQTVLLSPTPGVPNTWCWPPRV